MPTPDRQDPQTSHHAHLPPDYSSNLLHTALVVAGIVGKVSPLALTPAWLSLGAIACWPWQDLRLIAGVAALAFILADGIGLALLPRAGRSFGPVTPPLLALALVRTAVFVGGGLIWPGWPGLLLVLGLNLTILAAALYATWVEPFRVGVTQLTHHSPKLAGDSPLRLLHITDLHVERIAPRERQLLQRVAELSPDAILLTGDYLTLGAIDDPVAQAESHDLLASLCEIAGPRCPVYAITGSPSVDLPEIVPAIYWDLPITWLLNEVREINLNGHTLQLAGLRCTEDRDQDVPNLYHLLDGRAGDQFTVLLYHSPDLMPEAAALGVDLYLCGHTHGGQLRLPLFGALVTSSDFGKRYEMGRYEEGNTTLYVSRGLGVEGLGAPRARFLAPPEIVLWTLHSRTPGS
jgi:predicted MPP superfamily phosphohydrolase